MNKSKVTIVITVLMLVASSIVAAPKSIGTESKFSSDTLDNLEGCGLGSTCSTEYLCSHIIGGDKGIVEKLYGTTNLENECEKMFESYVVPSAPDWAKPDWAKNWAKNFCNLHIKQIKKSMNYQVNHNCVKYMNETIEQTKTKKTPVKEK